VAALTALVAAGPSPDEVRSAAGDVLSQSGVQKSIPAQSEEAMRGVVVRRRERPRSRQVGSTFGAIANILLWVLSIAAAVILVFWLASEFFGGRDELGKLGPGGELESARGPPDEDVVAKPLGDAEELARRGLFAEAIHVLLLRTLDELRRRSRNPIPRSLTSREILARVPLGDGARTELGSLVTAVEVTHFGDEVPGQDDYRMCLDHFQRFAHAYRGGA